MIICVRDQVLPKNGYLLLKLILNPIVDNTKKGPLPPFLKGQLAPSKKFYNVPLLIRLV